MFTNIQLQTRRSKFKFSIKLCLRDWRWDLIRAQRYGWFFDKGLKEAPCNRTHTVNMMATTFSQIDHLISIFTCHFWRANYLFILLQRCEKTHTHTHFALELNIPGNKLSYSDRHRIHFNAVNLTGGRWQYMISACPCREKRREINIFPLSFRWNIDDDFRTFFFCLANK